MLGEWRARLGFIGFILFFDLILFYYHVLGGCVIEVFLSELHQLLAEVHL